MKEKMRCALESGMAALGKDLVQLSRYCYGRKELPQLRFPKPIELQVPGGTLQFRLEWGRVLGQDVIRCIVENRASHWWVFIPQEPPRTSTPVEQLVDALRTPRKVVECLEVFERLQLWARARLEGLKRAEQEILRQQQRWVEELEARAALAAIGGEP